MNCRFTDAATGSNASSALQGGIETRAGNRSGTGRINLPRFVNFSLMYNTEFPGALPWD